LKDKISDNITGILGTLIFHLVLLIIFLSLKLGDVKRKHKEFMVIDFQEQEYDVEEIIRERIEELAETQQQLPAQMRRNIAVNAARELDEEISTEKYLEQLKEELGIEDLNPDFGSDPDNADYPVMQEEEEKTDESATSDYTGPTNITYYLENRRDIKLPVPVYKCEGGGDVRIDITVDREGRVINAAVAPSVKNVSSCLRDVALRYAYRARFNIDLDAPAKQKGYIIYSFVPQY